MVKEIKQRIIEKTTYSGIIELLKTHYNRQAYDHIFEGYGLDNFIAELKADIMLDDSEKINMLSALINVKYK